MISAPEKITVSQKAFASLQAHAALHGITVLESTDDRGRVVYIATRWALTKELPTLAALHAWLEQVTGRRV
jgi:hypothetical protein